MEVFGHLEQITAFVWDQLVKAPHQKRHPWRIATIANVVGQRVLQRSVVLRKAITNDRMLRFYTDVRSAKIQPLPENDRFSWLFYDPRRQVQLRLQTTARLLDSEQAAELWEEIPAFARKDYASIAPPGTIREELPLAAAAGPLAGARQNFGVVDCIIEQMEVLQLHREGHRRAEFQWMSETQSWAGHWLVP